MRLGLQSILKTWAEAAEIVSGKRGGYPFDEAGQKRLLNALKRARSNVDALRAEDLSTEPEALLMKADLRLLADGVREMRPTEMATATCYVPICVHPAREAMKLSQRAPLLEKMAAMKVVHAEVLDRVIGTMHADLEALQAHYGLPRKLGACVLAPPRPLQPPGTVTDFAQQRGRQNGRENGSHHSVSMTGDAHTAA